MLPATPKGSTGNSLRPFLNILRGKGEKEYQSTFQDSDWVRINIWAFERLEICLGKQLTIRYSNVCQIASISAYVQISGVEVKDVGGGGAYDQFSTSMETRATYIIIPSRH